MASMQTEHSKETGSTPTTPGRRQRVLTALSCLVLTAATGQGCGDTESESGGSVKTFDELLQELAQSVCRGECDASGGTYVEIRYGAECLEIYSLLYESVGASIKASLDAGRTSFDAEAAQRCLDLLAAEECDEADLACEDALVGKVATGDACTESTECAGNAYCREGLDCLGTCVATLGVGEACPGTDFDECGAGFFCSAEGVCTAEKANGEPCDYSEECSSYYCDYTEEGSRCVEIPPDYVKDIGALCDFDQECKPDLHCPQGTCTAAGEIGEPCPCVSEAYCSEDSADAFGVCVARIPQGEACEISGQCATGICDDGVCEKPSGLGGPCVTDDRCFGVCDDGACAHYPACAE